MMARSTLVALALVSLATVASAATLTDVVGNVSVNSGNGFRAAANGAVLQPGYRVSVAPGGGASILYDSGAAVPIAGGQTITVSGAAGVAPSQLSVLPGGAGGAGLAPEVIGGTLLVGGAAAIGIAAIASGGGSSSITILPPVSP